MKVLCTVVTALVVLFDSIVCEPDWYRVTTKKATKADIKNLLTGPFGHLEAKLPLTLLLLENILFGYMDEKRVARALYVNMGVGERHERVSNDIGKDFISKTVPADVEDASGGSCCGLVP
ncbi:uncharacterized protein LOC117179129 [Belonocnema kinseyi]|uniref:uncharacterized protein LOC117179129 n=1 Tax=Belonocnema kinseyi TaxID=2817044 RepID=UPI00143DD5EC|nr:uncharacterized protein LOC117179129 [Belonocnema kinseyi]